MALITERLSWAKNIFLHRTQPGAPPGIIEVDPVAPKPVINVLGYGPDGMEEMRLDDQADLQRWKGRWPVLWVDVAGLGDVAVLKSLAERFGIQPLTLEDVVYTSQRPKVEPSGAHTFVVVRRLEPGDPPQGEQLSLVLGEGVIITFQERQGDCWDPVRRRIREARGRIRSMGADYLLYALLDAVVDHYFPVLEDHVERVAALESEIMLSSNKAQIARILSLKHEFISIHRDVWPLREIMATVSREDLPHVGEEIDPFLRDCQDHAIQLVEMMESFRELAAGLMDLHMSMVSNRTNEVMKVLTVIATIFIPLTFVAGIYGMNFDPEVSPLNMPELEWYWGYPFAMGLMLAVALSLLFYFARKGWLGGGTSSGN